MSACAPAFRVAARVACVREGAGSPSGWAWSSRCSRAAPPTRARPRTCWRRRPEARSRALPYDHPGCHRARRLLSRDRHHGRRDASAVLRASTGLAVARIALAPGAQGPRDGRKMEL